MSDSNLKRVAELNGGPLALVGVGLEATDGSNTLIVEYTGKVAQIRGRRTDVAEALRVAAAAPFGVQPQPKTVGTANVATLAGLQTINGYVLQDGDLFLLAGQTDTTQNGLWLAHADSGGSAVNWTRPVLPVYSGQTYMIQGGGGSGKQYRLSTIGTITPGTTSQAFDIITTGNSGAAFDPASPGPIGGAAPDTGAFTTVTSTITTVGTTQAPGVTTKNTTAATAGNQKYSPGLELEGRGWKTDGGGSSQACKGMWQLRPVEGAANPTAELVYWSSIAGGAYAEVFKVSDAGVLTFSGSAGGLAGTYALNGTPSLKATLGVGTDNTHDVGDATHRLRNLYVTGLRSGAIGLTAVSSALDQGDSFGFAVDTTVALAAAGAVLFRASNNGTRKFEVAPDGKIGLHPNVHGLPADTSDLVGDTTAQTLSAKKIGGQAAIAAAADVVGLFAPDVNGAGHAGLAFTSETGGIYQQGVESAAATITTLRWDQDVNDDAAIALPSPTNLGRVRATTFDEEIVAGVKADLTCAKLLGSTNTDVADTDGRLNVWKDGAALKVTNRLGAARRVRIEYELS